MILTTFVLNNCFFEKKNTLILTSFYILRQIAGFTTGASFCRFCFVQFGASFGYYEFPGINCNLWIFYGPLLELLWLESFFQWFCSFLFVCNFWSVLFMRNGLISDTLNVLSFFLSLYPEHLWFAFGFFVRKYFSHKRIT